MKSYRYSFTRTRASLLLAIGCTACLPTVRAQLANTVPATEQSAKTEEVIELSPFEVKADKDEGYVAQNTTSGSRLNTSLKNTPAPISVFTKEFLDDLGVTDIASLSYYAMNTELGNGIDFGANNANGNEFTGAALNLRIRGLPSTRMVNFFPYGGEMDTYNTERVELSRGPNALLFGLGGAGGAFNSTTKKADLNRSIYAATLRFGDYDAIRGTVDINVPVVKGEAALRINALDAKKNSWRPFEHNNTQRLDLAGRWQINPKIVFNVEYEIANTDRATQRAWGGFDSYTDWHNAGEKLDPKVAAPGLTLAQTRAALGISTTTVSTATTTNYYMVWNATDGQVINYAAALAANVQSFSAKTLSPISGLNSANDNPLLLDFSVVPKKATIGGPGIGNILDQDVFTTSVTVEPVKNLFFDFGYNHEGTRSSGYDIGNNEIRVQWDTSPTTIAGTPNPHVGQPFIEVLPNLRYAKRANDDLRLSGSYELALGKIFGHHRLGAFLERRTELTANLSSNRKVVVNPSDPASADSGKNTFRYRTYVDLQGPVDNIASANIRDDPTGRSAWILSGPTDVKRIIDTRMALMQSYFWEDRIVGTLGYRDDRLKNYDSVAMRGPAYGPFAQGDLMAVRSAIPTEPSGITRTQGVVVNATPWASVFFDKSANFNITSATNRLAPNVQAPNADGVSRDMGVKISLLGGRIFATVTYFETAIQQASNSLNQGTSSDGINYIWSALNTTTRPGHTKTILAENGINIDEVWTNFNSFTLDTASQGWEYDLVANPTLNWRLSLSFTDTTSGQTNTAPELFAYMDKYRALWNANADLVTADGGSPTIGTELATIDADHLTRLVRPNGLQALGKARYASTLVTNYSFREGFLKGFSLGGAARWIGRTQAGYTATLDPLYVSGYTLVDANLGYRIKANLFNRKTDLTFQFNVTNLFNKDDIIPTRLFDNGATRIYRFQTPRDWFVTMTAKF